MPAIVVDAQEDLLAHGALDTPVIQMTHRYDAATGRFIYALG